MIMIPVTAEDAGKTVLAILQKRIPGAPRAYLRQLLRRGKVQYAGKALAEDHFLHGGETLHLPDSERLRKLCSTDLPPLEILLEADTFLAVFKPAGLAVHSSAGHEQDNLTTRVRTWMQYRKAPYMVAPVHRLDVGTSGPVLFGKGRKAIAELGRILQTGPCSKIYLALVRGMPPETGMLTSAVRVQDKTKHAATRFRVLGRHRDAALLELELLSGRKHQIRQQCADAGWPVYGDRRYGGSGLIGLERLFLHCGQLSWPAGTGMPDHCVTAPLPEELLCILRCLHIDPPSPA
ncbi:MAG: RluA family pseudouridine synthase [Syntrophotalea acetylenica]|nr:RluA family pseudouridine synthase [Syntrophotalea acetylenica]